MKRICISVFFASVLVTLIPQSLIAEKRETNRPLSGSLEGLAVLSIDVESVCYPGPETTTTATGNLSHLGLVAAHFSHCPSPPNSGLPTTHGSLILIAANGDQLWGTYEDEDGLPPFVVQFKNGTGRFKKAEGTADVNWQIEDATNFFEPFRWWATIEGRISY